MTLSASNLFRSEALQSSHNRLNGNVILINAPTFTHVTWLLVLIIVISLGFVSQARFSTYESVDGILKSAGSELKVYPREHSVITNLRVKEGQQVAVGDELLSLRSSSAKVEGESEMELEKAELESQIQTLMSKKQILDSSYQLKRQKLQISLENNKQEAVSIKSKVVLLEERESILKALYLNKKKLMDEGSISENEVNAARIEYLLVQESLHDRRAAIEQSEGSLKELEYDLASLPVNLQMELANIDNDISQLKKQLIKLSSEIEYTIQARQSGIVSNIVALEGELVYPGYPILVISAAKNDLIAELYVPSRAIGFVKRGLKVHVRFDAFPHQYYGDIVGEVVEVSKVLLFPTEWPNPLDLKKPVYRVKVRLQSDSILAKGETIHLQKGLRVNADIVLEEKSVLDYLLSPIIDIKNKMH